MLASNEDGGHSTVFLLDSVSSLYISFDGVYVLAGGGPLKEILMKLL